MYSHASQIFFVATVALKPERKKVYNDVNSLLKVNSPPFLYTVTLTCQGHVLYHSAVKQVCTSKYSELDGHKLS